MAGKQAGFSLVEVILSSAVFVLLVTALVGAYLYGQEATALAGNRARANMLAEEGLEAVRNIRDANFANLTDGTYGLTTTGNQWNLSGSSDVTDIFTRQIVISTVDTKRKSVTANVTWQQNPQRSGAIFFITYLTNWIRAVGQADGLVINTTGANLGGGNKELRGITLENIGEIDIVIDKITVTWNNGNLIEEIKIEGTKVWKYDGSAGSPSGKQPSGTELNIVDYTIDSGNTDDIDKFKFDGSMTGATFNITFTMGDGSTKSTGNFSP